jgi:rubredoxin
MNDKVRLRPAYAWTCPECGCDHFERGIVPEMSEEDLQHLREEHGIEPEEDGVFVMMPDSVFCLDCKRDFETIHYSSDDEET